MTETTSRTTKVTTAQAVRDATGPTTLRRWLPLSVITLILLSAGVWADEPKAEPATIAQPTATIQANEAAETAAEKSSQTATNKPTVPADWKPPEMPAPPPFSTQKIDPEVVKELKDRWGVELLGIRNSAAGMFLDFRFKVLDADKSLPLFDHRIKPYVIAEKSAIKLPVPIAAKVGAFRPTNRGKNIKSDKTYYILFGNPDRHVKTGETVTVVIGDFKVEHLIVN
jgi:hypothetical protein